MSARRRWGVPGALLFVLAPLTLAAVPPSPGSPGAALFQDHCGLCHAAGGTGTFMLARRLGTERSLLADRTDLSAQYVTQVVRHGLQSMPRMTRVELTDAELAAIAAFLAAPKKPQP